jgi:hypothetical protein
MVVIHLDWDVLREPLGASGRKDGAVGATGEKLQQKRPSNLQKSETSQREISETKER